MKKSIVWTLMVMFLTAASGSVFAAETGTVPTPVAKTAKHKVSRKKKKRMKKAMKTAKPSGTPAAK